MKHFFKIFLVFFLIFSIAIGTGLKIYLDKDEKEKEAQVKANKIEELEEKVEKERVNILLLGIDALDGKYSENNSRTDTMMLFSMDPENNSAFLLSIPRDSRVKIRNHGMDKINHAHAYGGVDLSLKAVKDLLQIPIHHYIRVDYQALFKTIDDIGGIEIDVPMNMYWSDPYATPPLLINLKKGKQILDGQKSMEYLRFRSGYAGNPDIVRIQAQQDFVQKVMEKILSPASVARVPKYIDTMYTYVDTDMSKKDMLELAKDGVKLDPAHLKKMTLPGEGRYVGIVSYFILDEPKMREDIKFLLAGNYPSTEETNGEAETGENTKINNLNSSNTKNAVESKIEEKPQTVIIQNGSGKNGVAKRASDLLKISDITVNKTSNADNFNYEKTIVYYNGNKKFAQQVKDALGKGQLSQNEEKLKTYKTDILVVIGKDF